MTVNVVDKNEFVFTNKVIKTTMSQPTHIYKGETLPKCSACGWKAYSWGSVRDCSCRAYLCVSCYHSRNCRRCKK